MNIEDDDQIAVLCILSHGEDGYVYGCDGNTVPVNEILQSLDNTRCVQMAGKPKIVIIQTCQGGELDYLKCKTSP